MKREEIAKKLQTVIAKAMNGVFEEDATCFSREWFLYDKLRKYPTLLDGAVDVINICEYLGLFDEAERNE